MRTQRTTWVSLLLIAEVVMVAFLAGCPGRPQEGPAANALSGASPAGNASVTGAFKMTGSTTVLPIATAWQQAFNKEYPKVDIAIGAGGSGTGIKDLIAKSTDIANSSREMKPEEKQQAQAAGVTPVERMIAYDGIAVIVNPANPLSEISLERLSDVYTGQIKRWDEVGAAGLGEVQLVARDSSSGTYESFKDMVVTLHGKAKGRDYAPTALKQASNEAIRTLVAQTAGAIGYVGLGFVDSSVKVLAVLPAGGGTSAKPSAETVRSGRYAISRKLYCYTNGAPTGVVKTFLDWAEGPEGQALVEKAGFIPVTK